MRNILRRRKFWLLAPLILAISGLVGIVFIDQASPFPRHLVESRLAGAATLIRTADATPLAWTGEQNPLRLPVRLATVSPWLVSATIAVEDKRFQTHPGVDPVAVMRAFVQNTLSMRRISGASTLTMQVVRLLQPRSRTWAGKAVEAFRAWQLERWLDKDRILELYLGLAPYGDVIGAEAAAWRYFGKAAADLDLAEAALLAGLPQSPDLFNPAFNPGAATRRRDFVIGRLAATGVIDVDEAAAALATPLTLAPVGDRLAAPHFVRYANRHAVAGEPVLDTTLDSNLQRLTALLSERHVVKLAAKNPVGLAATVISTRDSSILAYVGDALSAASPDRPDGVSRGMRLDPLLQPLLFALLADGGPATPALVKVALGNGGENGGAGTEQCWNLLGIANAYAALARNGVWMPVRLASDLPDRDPAQAVSPGAAWHTLAVLANVEDETAHIARAAHSGVDPDGRNAWAVVVGAEAVAAVWCGIAEAGPDLTETDVLPLAEKLLEAATRDRQAALTPPAVPYGGRQAATAFSRHNLFLATGLHASRTRLGGSAVVSDK